MQRIETTTTEFKRALKTVTDTLTATEQKTYDVPLQISYENTTGTITMVHPVNQMIVSADFEGELLEESVLSLFYIGSLSDDLKAYRRKEALYVDVDNALGILFIRTEGEVFYEALLEEGQLATPKTLPGYTFNRKDFIELLYIGQAITKTTFHESTMALHFIAYKNSLQVRATNFAQLSTSKLTLGATVKKPIKCTLSAKEITKVRNVIERGKGKQASFYMRDDYFIIQTDTTRVAFKDMEDIVHIDGNQLIKSLKWDKDIYNVNTDSQLEVVKTQYQLLIEAEKEKEEEDIEKYENIYLIKDSKKKSVNFSQEPLGFVVNTRDMNSLLQRLPETMDVAFNEDALLFNYKDESKQVLLLLPVITVETEQREG